LFPATGADENSGVAGDQLTIAVFLFRRVAVTTLRNNLVGLGVVHLNPDALVKDIAETVKVPALDGGIFAVSHDSTVELVDIVEAFLFDVAG
jgi:hypothetical protein